MAALEPSRFDVDLPDLGFAVLTLGSLAGTLFGQLLWIIVFDETGLDRAVPDPVFTVVLPALTVTLLPIVAAYYLYSRKMTLAVATGVFAGGLAVSMYTIQFFALCGPGC